MADLVPVLTPAPPTASTTAATVHAITTVSIRLPVTVATTWADFDGQGGRTGVLDGQGGRTGMLEGR